MSKSWELKGKDKEFDDLIEQGKTQIEMAEYFGVTRQAISARTRYVKRFGKRGRLRRLTKEQAEEIREAKTNGISNKQLALKYGVGETTISVCARGEGVYTK